MKVVLTSDWHIGASGSVFLENAKMLKERWKGKTLIILGDTVDIGIDRGMAFDNDINPQDQINEVVSFLEGLTVAGYVNGNHEERVFRNTGINILETALHMKPSNLIEVRSKWFYINHGKSFAQNTFLEHSKFLQFIPEVSVLALGHNHDLAKRAMIRAGKLMYIARTGSFLEEARYAIQAGYPPRICGWMEYETERSHLELYGLFNGRVRRL